jgi:hypothetical protein
LELEAFLLFGTGRPSLLEGLVRAWLSRSSDSPEMATLLQFANGISSGCMFKPSGIATYKKQRKKGWRFTQAKAGFFYCLAAEDRANLGVSFIWAAID